MCNRYIKGAAAGIVAIGALAACAADAPSQFVWLAAGLAGSVAVVAAWLIGMAIWFHTGSRRADHVRTHPAHRHEHVHEPAPVIDIVSKRVVG